MSLKVLQAPTDYSELAKSVKSPRVYTPEFDQNFRPIVGKVKVAYNGCWMEISVYETAIAGLAIFPGAAYEIKFEQPEVQSFTWAKILQEYFVKVRFIQVSAAMKELELLKSNRSMQGKSYYVQ